MRSHIHRWSMSLNGRVYCSSAMVSVGGNGIGTAYHSSPRHHGSHSRSQSGGIGAPTLIAMATARTILWTLIGETARSTNDRQVGLLVYASVESANIDCLRLSVPETGQCSWLAAGGRAEPGPAVGADECSDRSCRRKKESRRSLACRMHNAKERGSIRRPTVSSRNGWVVVQ